MAESRRGFLKKSALSTAIMAATTRYEITADQTDNKFRTLSRPSCEIPIIAEVDVAVVGGGFAAVAAAIQASKKAKVFLMSEETYLGEDLCGTMRYHQSWSEKAPKFLEPLLKKTKNPIPMEYKTFLDAQILKAEIPFLLTSHVSRVIFDNADRVIGLVIVNRNGEQVIKCKSIIDATADGSVLRYSNISMNKRSTKPFIEYTTFGDWRQPKKDLINSTKITYKKNKYLYHTYRFEGVSVADKIEKSKAESLAQAKTWYGGVLDSADQCFYYPNYQVKVKGQTGLDSTKLTENPDVFALNGYGIESTDQLKSYLSLASMINLGEQLGASVATQAKSRPYGESEMLKASENEVKVSPYSIYRDKFETLSAPSENLPVFDEVDVVVVGGGTAGAAAGVGAAENGMKTLVIEPLHGLGGTGTIGAIVTYYYGYEGGFNKRVDKGVGAIGGDHPSQKGIKPNKKWQATWKMEWYRQEIEKLGGNIWFGTTVCGAIVKGKSLQGVVVGSSFGKGIVLAKRVIDATGSSDVAIAAGAAYEYTNKDHVAIQGSGVPMVNISKNRYGYNSDWTFITEFDAFDCTRAYTMAKTQYERRGGAPFFDSGKMIQSRERRRIVGDYTIKAMDVVHNRTYSDAISYHRSNFDTHGYTVDPYFQLKPTNEDAMEAAVPLSALLPKGYENIVVTGLGFSAHRDTMPVLRMQRCLQNQGHALGYLSAQSIKKNQGYRQIDIKPIQAYLKKLGTLPSRLRCADSKEVTEATLDKVVASLNMKLDGLETLLLNPKLSFEKLKDCLKTSTNQEQKHAAAFILGMYGFKEGTEERMEIVSKDSEWDEGWNFKGMRQFYRSSSPLDDKIMAMGRGGGEEILKVLEPMAKKLNNKSELSHFRAVAVACEEVKSKQAVPMLSRILKMFGETQVTRTIKEAKEKALFGVHENMTRTLSLRELMIARALYRCGDDNNLGEERLKLYAKDLRGQYALHAQAVLAENKA